MSKIYSIAISSPPSNSSSFPSVKCSNPTTMGGSCSINNSMVLRALDCWCCHYIAYGTQDDNCLEVAKLRETYNTIDFKQKCELLSHYCANLQSTGVSSTVSISNKSNNIGLRNSLCRCESCSRSELSSFAIQFTFRLLMMLIDNFKTRGFNSFVKHLPQLKKILNDSRDSLSNGSCDGNTHELVQFVHYFEMTTTLTLTHDQTINPIVHTSTTGGTTGLATSGSIRTELDEIQPILDIYGKTLSLSRRLRNSEDVDEINGLLMEATFWETKLESLKPDTNHLTFNSSTTAAGKEAYFEFFKLVGKLLFNQLIQQNQSSATKTKLLT
ncbi:unnamed protein product [Ambrosiozyma monospora]|uniref:Unnamed protein product n=1 Tax=Ambrosiozyma monospora TaxID=43982 RepID=A0ACB5TCS1_AMBMO|nr:unnamed protein product [Ambrosiozyma monospora]